MIEQLFSMETLENPIPDTTRVRQPESEARDASGAARGDGVAGVDRVARVNSVGVQVQKLKLGCFCRWRRRAVPVENPDRV